MPPHAADCRPTDTLRSPIQVKLNNVNVEGSPFDCTLDPGPPDPTRSTATGTSAQIIASQGGSNGPDGKARVGDVTVLLRDQFNNDCSSGYQVEVSWPDSPGTMVDVISDIPTTGNHRIQYHTSTNGAYSLKIVIGADDIQVILSIFPPAHPFFHLLIFFLCFML